MKDILLLGHRGYLGSYLFNNLNVDILSTRNIYNNHKNYQYVINCIGVPDLEYCEQHKDETDYSNRDIIHDIQHYYPSSKIINFSSYYVYDDIGYCTENSNVTNKYNYTRQKLEAERLIHNGISFRVGKLFGYHSNTQYKLTEHIIQSTNITLDEVYFNPCSVQQILSVILFELKYQNLNGIYNLANSGSVSHYDYGYFIDRLLQTNKNINKVSKIDKPFDNYGRFQMSCDKLNQHVTLTPWDEDLKKYIISL
jgi:dTDP-4-dehydrorhamnose reductase